MKQIFLLFFLTLYSAYAYGNDNNRFHQCMETMSTKINIEGIENHKEPTPKDIRDILQKIAEYLAGDKKCLQEFILHSDQTAKFWQKHNDKEYAYTYNINDALVQIFFDKIAFWVFSKDNGTRYYPGDIVNLTDLKKYETPWWNDMCSDWSVNPWSNVDDDAEMSIDIGVKVFGDLDPDYKNDEFIIDVVGKHKFFPGMIYRDITGRANDDPVYIKQFSVALKYYKELTQAMSTSTYCKDQDVYLILPLDVSEETDEITILYGPYKN